LCGQEGGAVGLVHYRDPARQDHIERLNQGSLAMCAKCVRIAEDLRWTSQVDVVVIHCTTSHVRCAPTSVTMKIVRGVSVRMTLRWCSTRWVWWRLIASAVLITPHQILQQRLQHLI
jgi:hypothetical protein